MLASVVLASFLCTIQPNQVNDDCSSSFEIVWGGKPSEYSKAQYGADKKDCLKEKERRYPDIETIDVNTFRVAACYRVVPEKEADTPEGFVYLQNIIDPEDHFLTPSKYVIFD